MNFSSAVKEYKRLLPKKGSLVIFIKKRRDAFFSLAPLSRAAHELGLDVFVGNEIDFLNVIWSSKDESVKNFKKLAGIKIKKPIVLRCGDSFIGDIVLPYFPEWAVSKKNLDKTCISVWKNVFSAKKKERALIRFELIPKKCFLDDYLDNFLIAWEMIMSCPSKVIIRASTSRDSMNAPPEPTSELINTMMGCELSSFSKEPVFKAYRVMQKKLNLPPLIPVDLVFGIVGKGYYGKHKLGDKIGYPIPASKLRWQSPASMMYKFPWMPQSPHDKRLPVTRIGFTQTIPVKEFIDTCLIDWNAMRNKNKAIERVLKKCQRVHVKGVDTPFGRTEFTVDYQLPNGKLRGIKRSDSDARNIVNKEILKESGKSYGVMANIPGGECFVTPQSLKGRFIGDVVIAIDDSYVLSAKNPLIVESDGEEYKIVSGPKKVLNAFNKHISQSYKRLMQNKSLPKEIKDMKKRNFKHIGEFAINTNEKASLSRYLIVNEKIADMIHIALGSGFDPDTATVYHCDIVIDSPRQKLDVTAYDGKKGYSIIKKGKLVLKS